MKTLIATSFTALLLAGAAAANAASPGTSVIPGAATTGTVTTPYTYGNHGSEALPIFNYQNLVPLSSVIGPRHTISILPWNTSADLVNQTGGAR